MRSTRIDSPTRIDPAGCLSPAPTPGAVRHPNPPSVRIVPTPSVSVPVRHSVVALIGSIDLRAVLSVDAARLLGGDRVTALHVVEPGEDVDELARRWMRLRCSTVPFRTVDADIPADLASGTAAMGSTGDVARAVADAVVPDDPSAIVTLVLARLQFARRWHRWLHDQTAEHIAAAVEPLAQVRVLWVPVPMPR
jgi:hypothetical protein